MLCVVGNEITPFTHMSGKSLFLRLMGEKLSTNEV